MKEFSHPHIITLHGWTFNSNDYYILMELAPYGEVGEDTYYYVHLYRGTYLYSIAGYTDRRIHAYMVEYAQILFSRFC